MRRFVSKTIERLLYSRIFGLVVLVPLVKIGYRLYRRRGTTPTWAYSAMRKLYGNTTPKLFRSTVATLVDSTEEPINLVSSVFPEPLATDQVLEALRNDGIVVLEQRLPQELCELIRISAESMSKIPVGDQNSTVLSELNCPRLDFLEQDLLRSSAIRDVMFDSSLYQVAARYLECAPIQDLVAMWWTQPTNGGPSSKAAQLFHFDLDRPRFLKVFCYLTDVDDKSGPHVFVRRSHKNAPSALRRDRRYTDPEVHQVYPEDELEIVGSAGTIFLADTLGLHKGLPSVSGRRLVLQFEYCSSLFGAPYARYPEIDWSEWCNFKTADETEFTARFRDRQRRS